MKKKITRRDFLNGAAIAIAAAGSLSPRSILAMGKDNAAPSATIAGPAGIGKDYYPPTLTGIRGSHDGSFEVAHQLAWAGQIPDYYEPLDGQHPSNPVTHLQAQGGCHDAAHATANAISPETRDGISKGRTSRRKRRLNHGCPSWRADYGNAALTPSIFLTPRTRAAKQKDALSCNPNQKTQKTPTPLQSPTPPTRCAFATSTLDKTTGSLR